MKRFITSCISLFFIFSVSAETVPGTDLTEKVFDLDLVDKDTSSRNAEQIAKDVNALNSYIGSYPPRFSDEEQRNHVYRFWLTLTSDAEAHAKQANRTENALYLLSELYRQGHNMDVQGSAERALAHLDECFDKYPKSEHCHISASYFYLSIGPTYLDRAEHSLSFLRDFYLPDANDEVEAGYVFLYLYRQDVKSAKSQIDRFATMFPDSKRTPMFANIKEQLGDTIEYKEH